ncbi:hypothetical protein MBGDF03_00361 [Thermoplasmatales archaeon SCGC AB-540-F20]|nr:hypothetical protein MBGDF03_00361 [Thermoplasmatales archaeon SCGC AB-540-F20]
MKKLNIITYMRIWGKRMKKKILIGVIIAVVMLVVMSSSPAVFVSISGWKIVARDEHGASTEGPIWSFTTRGNSPPMTPIIIGYENETLFFYTIDPDDDVKYFIDWDDGTVDETDWYPSGQIVEISHSWPPGKYNIRIKAMDIYGAESDWSSFTIIIGNHPPCEPEICGPTRPIVGVEYEYTFNAIDPDGENVSYYIDWGDDTSTGWIGPFPSGVDIHCSHAWYEKVNYLLRCKAKDIWNCESDWSSLIIWRSKNQQSQNIWLQLLCEKLPILYRLVHILGW